MSRSLRTAAAGLLALAALTVALAGGAGSAAHAQSAYAPPPIRHVFIVMLENEDQATSFGLNSPAPYLSKTLPSMGELLTHYYGTGHESLDNYVSLISGQGPNPVTQSDCQFYTDVTPGTVGADGQAAGMGCVYPSAVQTIANQLADKGLTWKGYMEDMGNSTTETRTCRHPALNSQDDTQSARAGDQYAARHNPFVYFHSIIDSPMCNADDVPYDQLAGDLRSADTTPNYSFITPNLCDDGHDSPCKDGRPGGLKSADAFLQTLIPQILASPAYQQDGLLVIAFDESSSGADSCCGEQAANSPNAGGPTPGSGGGQVGAVLLSPFVAPGTINNTPYNHYSLLRSAEDVFGLAHLGYAGASGLKAFGPDVYNAGATPASPAPAQTPGTPVSGCRGTHLARSARGNLRRGTLISSASAAVTGGRLTLRVNVRRSAHLYVTLRGGSRARRVLSRRVFACRAYAFGFAAPRGRRPTITLLATIRKARERRILRVR